MKKIISLISLLFAITTMYATDVYVTNASDTTGGPGLTLRTAIMTTANSGDSIIISNDIVSDLQIDTITLASTINFNVSKNLILNGRNCVLQPVTPGVSNYRPFTINLNSFRNVSLYNLTLIGGDISGQASGDASNGACLLAKRATTLYMYNCTLKDGIAKRGGALADATTVGQQGSMKLIGCTFINNKSTDKGAAAVQITGDAGYTYLFTDCTFKENSSTSGSGTTAAFLTKPAIFTNCVFLNNVSAKADPSATDIRVAALHFEHSLGTSIVENCLFNGNVSQAKSNSNAVGGSAITHKSVGNAENTSSLIIKNSTFTDNRGGKAAVYLCDGYTSIVNCTFAGNRSGDPSYGGAICMKDSINDNTLTLVNNIFAYNYCSNSYSSFANVAFGGAKDITIAATHEGFVSGSNNLIAVGSGTSALTSPVSFTYDADPANDSPLFATYITNDGGKKVPELNADGTIHLLDGSVAYGAGAGVSDPTYGSLVPAKDALGTTRAATPCIGAYEFIPANIITRALTKSANFISTYYVGDIINNSGAWNFQFEHNWNDNWNATEVGVGQNADGATGWTWLSASPASDQSGITLNKKVEANIGNIQLTDAGTWYVIGRARGAAGTEWSYAANDASSTNNVFSTSIAQSFTVNALQAPLNPTADNPTVNSIDLSFDEWNNFQMLVVRYLDTDNETAPVDGTPYTAGNTIGAGKVIFNGWADGTGGSNDTKEITDNSLEAGTAYKYYFYSVNYNYYSAGVTASATTLDTGTSIKNAEILKNIRVIGNQIIVNSENGSSISVYNAVGQLLTSQKLVKGENRINIGTTGIVIVKAGNQVMKAVIR